MPSWSWSLANASGAMKSRRSGSCRSVSQLTATAPAVGVGVLVDLDHPDAGVVEVGGQPVGGDQQFVAVGHRAMPPQGLAWDR
jgi:hypothetical protein